MGPAAGRQPVAGRDGHRHGLPEGHQSARGDRLATARDVAAAWAGPGSTTARWRLRHRFSGRPRARSGRNDGSRSCPSCGSASPRAGALRVAPETARLLRQISISAWSAAWPRAADRAPPRTSCFPVSSTCPLARMGAGPRADWPARSKWIARTAVALAIALSILRAAGTDASLLFDARYDAKSYLRRNVPNDAIVEADLAPTYLPRLREMGFTVRLIAEQSSGDDALSGPPLVAPSPRRDRAVLQALGRDRAGVCRILQRPACSELRPPGHRVPGESALAENWRRGQSGIRLSRQPHDLDPSATPRCRPGRAARDPWPAT